MSIISLSQDDIAQIKSSVEIVSLNEVVLELFKNSLDANATKIELNVDFSRGSCMIEDNGLGISPSEFHESGDTSKQLGLENTHGGRGIFLASLLNVSLLIITSRHHEYRSHNTLTFNHSVLLSRQTPAAPKDHLHSDHGTRVTVHNLFGNMPVRVRQRRIIVENLRGNQKEWEDLVSRILRVLLSWPKTPLTVTMRNNSTNHKLLLQSPISQVCNHLGIQNICSILRQASFIAAEDTASWVSVESSNLRLNITGAISLKPYPTKRCQFLSFGIRPVSPEECSLYDELNKYFYNSNYGNIESVVEVDEEEERRRKNDRRYKRNGYTLKELRGQKKGIEKWPKFYLNIKSEDLKEFNTSGFIYNFWQVSEDTNNKIKQLLGKMTWQFLRDNNFCPRKDNEARLNKQSLLKFPMTKSLWESEHQDLVSEQLSDSAYSTLKYHYTANDEFQKRNEIPVTCQSKRVCKIPFQTQSKIKFGITANTSLTPSQRCSSKLKTSFIEHQSFYALSSYFFPTVSTHKKDMATKINQSGHLSMPKESQISYDNLKDTSNCQNRLCLSFEDTNINSDLVQSPFSNQRTTSSQRDHITSWINPITKKKNFVNMRTGLTAGSSKHSLDASSSLRWRQFLTSSVERNNPSSWISKLLNSWNSPIYLPTEQTIRQVPMINTTMIRGKNPSSRFFSRFDSERETSGYTPMAYKSKMDRISKQALRKAKFIAQVDKKFILVKLSIGHDEESVSLGERLIIIDQHAADERIRIEYLLEELCKPNPIMSSDFPCPIKTHVLVKPLTFDIPCNEFELLSNYQNHFSNWGILFYLSPPRKSGINSEANPSVTVKSLPPIIAGRCQSQPHLVISLLRTEIWRIHQSQLNETLELSPQSGKSSSWIDRVHLCPIKLRDLLNARACRGAIMFNDELSRDQCLSLVYRLAECSFPFQCAHGRPSMVPLVELMSMNSFSNAAFQLKEYYGIASAQHQNTFGAQFKQWSKKL